jgi:hypothetical protein
MLLYAAALTGELRRHSLADAAVCGPLGQGYCCCLAERCHADRTTYGWIVGWQLPGGCWHYAAATPEGGSVGLRERLRL